MLDGVNSELAEAKKDSARLDWLQKGHCVLCLVSHRSDYPYDFEIDGHQDAPRHPDIRQAIDAALAADGRSL